MIETLFYLSSPTTQSRAALGPGATRGKVRAEHYCRRQTRVSAAPGPVSALSCRPVVTDAEDAPPWAFMRIQWRHGTSSPNTLRPIRCISEPSNWPSGALRSHANVKGWLANHPAYRDIKRKVSATSLILQPCRGTAPKCNRDRGKQGASCNSGLTVGRWGLNPDHAWIKAPLGSPGIA